MFHFLRKFIGETGGSLGVELGGDALRVAQLSQTKDQYALEAAACIPFESTDTDDPLTLCNRLREHLRTALTAAKIRPGRAVLALPQPLVYTRHVRIDKSDTSNIESAARAELAGMLPVDPSACSFRFVTAGEIQSEQGSKIEVIAFAVAKDVVAELIDAAESAKLNVVGLLPPAMATARAFGRLFTRRVDTDGVSLYIDLQPHHATAIALQGAAMSFCRTVQVGVSDVANFSNESSDPSPAIRLVAESDTAVATLEPATHTARQRLCDEIDLCRCYHDATFPNAAIARVMFVGPGAADREMCQSIAQMLHLPAQIADASVRLKISESVSQQAIDRRQPKPQWNTVFGLAIEALGEGGK